jgi:hypothetical protein
MPNGKEAVICNVMKYNFEVQTSSLKRRKNIQNGGNIM